MQHALDAHDFGTLLRLVMAETGLPQYELAAVVGISTATFSRLLAGTHRLTNIDRIVDLAQGLGVPDHLWPVRRPGATMAQPALAEVWESAADIGRRVGLAQASNTSAAALTLFGSEIQQLVAHYEADGPHGTLRLADRAVRLRHTVHSLLEGHQPASHRTGLFNLAAQTSALLGYMAVNRGLHALADAYSNEAIAFASDTNDIATMMWACGTKSLNAYYQGDPERAAACAAEGIDLAPDHPQAIRLLVNGLARALGKVGDHAGACRAVGRAEDLSARTGVPGGLTPCISLEPYGYTRTLANAATVHVSLGNTESVLRYAADISEQVLTGDSAWSRALVQLDVATAQTTGSHTDIEHAMLLGRQVLDAHSDGPLILSVVQRARELHQIAEPFNDVAAVREYGEALRQWISTPRVSKLRSSATMQQPPVVSGKGFAHGPAGTPPRLLSSRPAHRP
ncbi:helix-turn-helix domain-containing protein [Streptomyces xanthochromogenes]|uniref:helix-turn-helix domain-containing protein n=1 Tax=Streptomyces xanthochromogenes TaxID=67384 RepID=UPI0038301ADC